MQTPFAGLKQQVKSGSLKATAVFSDENIQRIFGHEAAEDEAVERLKEYYFKNDTFEQVSADLKLRILVGHKGIGKSALFKVASSEDEAHGILPIHVQPDDIINIDYSENFLKSIRNWREGLIKIITDKIISNFAEGVTPDSSINGIHASKIMNAIVDVVKELKLVTSSKQAIYDNFITNKRVNVYIDDLDRGWRGTVDDINHISALLSAIRDVSNDTPSIHFKVALRSDVYFLVRTSDQDTDKIEGSVVWYKWTNNEILAMLAKRIETYYKRTISEEEIVTLHQSKIAEYFKPVMVETFDGVGKWEGAPIYRILTSVIRRRPRDLVKLCSSAARNANKRGKGIIETEDFQAIFDSYSLERIQDTINEFKSELPDIQRLLFQFKPSVKKSSKYSDSYVMKTSGVLDKITNASSSKAFYFSCTPNEAATPNELLHFLYKINFLTGRRTDKEGKPVRKCFEENKYITSKDVDFGFNWEVHPAYRWALEPDDYSVIYNKLELLNIE